MNNTCMSSGQGTSSGLIRAGESVLVGAELNSAGATCQLLVYDSATTAVGVVIAELQLSGNTSSATFFPVLPVRAGLGLYASIAGTGATFVLLYDGA